MSTFYLMPARVDLGRRFAALLQNLFPGTYWPMDDAHDLGEALGTAAMGHPDVYVIYAEDLPDEGSLDDTLMLNFGAEPGDQIVEVRPGRTLADVRVLRWRLGEALAA